jgi:hypothetical protein
LEKEEINEAEREKKRKDDRKVLTLTGLMKGLDHFFAIAIYDFGAAAGFGLGMTKVQAPPKTMVFPRV